jgi:type IV pilus assembly protein PilX
MLSRKTPLPNRYQQGAALVTSLLLLLVVTIVGVTAMQMTRMQERMAGNTRDRNLSLQGAEAALRNAERMIVMQNFRPIPCTAPPCNFWESGALPDNIGASNGAWWTTNARTYGTGAQELADLDEDPSYVIEEYLRVRIDGGVVQGEPNPDVRDFYVITARSTGASGQATVVLQSTYTRKY